ncbi:hypothetical protein C5S29_04470, partial [ANME-1 cluster archaeon GoMg3.2]|nr:hypothetical protein [ANME-1 cluster archaeon GoMg3.2]
GLKFAYSTKGHGIIEHDYITGLERELAKLPSPEDLWGRLKDLVIQNSPIIRLHESLAKV